MKPPVKTMDELTAYIQDMFGADADRFMELIKANEGFETAMQNAAVNAFEYSTITSLRRMDEIGMKGPHYYYINLILRYRAGTIAEVFHSSDLWFWFETLAKCLETVCRKAL